jgi:hypothetical protein
VTVERPRADLGAPGDLVHTGLRASVRENLPRDLENPLTVALRVCAGFAGTLFGN